MSGVTDLIAEAMVQRLQAKLTDFETEHFPDNPDGYPFDRSERVLLVNYEGSAYQAPASIDPMFADRPMEFAVTVLVRNLRGPDGATETIDRVRRALFGWRPVRVNELDVAVPLGGTAFVPTKDSFVGHQSGVWRFAITFTTTAPVVAESEPLTGPPLAGISMQAP